MYNLIVGFEGDVTDPSRVLEWTADHLKSYFKTDDRVAMDRLLNLPTLMMPEMGDGDAAKVALVGYLEYINVAGRGYRFKFKRNTSVPPISAGTVKRLAGALQIDEWEFTRTHWAVKAVDLYRIVMQHGSSGNSPKVFKVPEGSQEDLVAVMMPFGPSFAPVYEAIKKAVEPSGLRCQRVDDIWLGDAIIDDIVSLIWRARIVVSDLSQKNPNVFYETGIAHAFGRDVIQVTQSEGDVPFDLKHLRFIPYLPNKEGLEGLIPKITERIDTILQNAASRES